jgi:hypothetical protein
MRRYADPVEVRQGPIDQGPIDQGSVDGPGSQGVEGPQQFLWRGRLWKVRAVLAHWVETGPWWQSIGARAVIGSEGGPAESDEQRGPTPIGDLLTERELWRVEAGRPRPPAITPDGEVESGISGVFDLSFDWAEGRWTLVGCTD